MPHRIKHDKRTGYLLIAHGALAQEFLSTLRFVAGSESCGHFRAVAIDHAVDVDRAREIVEEAIASMQGPDGVIVLTDLFGGAPTNIALSAPLGKIPFEIVAGVNLPLLLNATLIDDTLPLHEKAVRLKRYGQENIFLASDVLAGRSERKEAP
jgi:PTS system mannose-specific IIA component